MSAKEQTKNRVAIAGQVIDAETKLGLAEKVRKQHLER